MTNRTPKELLKEFFHFSYHVYSMDEMIEKLEQLTEKMPKWEREYNLEHGRALLQQGDVYDAIKKLNLNLNYSYLFIAKKNIYDANYKMIKDSIFRDLIKVR